jgi:hypothetical protein
MEALEIEARELIMEARELVRAAAAGLGEDHPLYLDVKSAQDALTRLAVDMNDR